MADLDLREIIAEHFRSNPVEAVTIHGQLGAPTSVEFHAEVVADAAAEALSDAGLMVVPVEPSEAELDAAWSVLDDRDERSKTPSITWLREAFTVAREAVRKEHG